MVRQTSTAIDVSLSGVSASVAPFSFVLGQSLNSGWQASIGGHALSTPVLTDGFANGWIVNPASFGSAIHNGTLSVTLRWTPQRTVNIALLISAVALVVCILLAIAPWARRRRRRRRGPGSADADVSPGSDIPVGHEADYPQVAPELVSSASDQTDAVEWGPMVVVAIVVATAATLIASPLTGVIVGVGTVVALRKPEMRLWLGLAAVACLLGAGGYILISQWSDPTRSTGGWPTGFGGAAGLAWAAVMFLGADATVELVFRRRAAKEALLAEPAQSGSSGG